MTTTTQQTDISCATCGGEHGDHQEWLRATRERHLAEEWQVMTAAERTESLTYAAEHPGSRACEFLALPTTLLLSDPAK